MTHRIALASLLASSLVLAACQGQGHQDWVPGADDASLLHDLGPGLAFEVAPSTPEGGSFANTRALALRAGAAADVNLPITGGSIELRATHDGLVVLETLEVEAADVVIPPEMFPPRGLHLTGLRLVLDRPAVFGPDEGIDRLTAIGELDLRAEWAIALDDGRSSPLGPLSLEGLPVSLEIDRDSFGNLSVRVVAFRDGSFWRWAETFELADLAVDIHAR